MTKHSLTVTSLQLIGVYFACDIIAKSMAFTVFEGTSGQIDADWMRIWIFNGAFWVVGLFIPIALIFFASPLATFLAKLTRSDINDKAQFGSITSEVVVQLFAGLLLVRQLHLAASELISLFKFSSYGDTRLFVMFLYFAFTIGVSIWLIRCPQLLANWRRMPTEDNKKQNKSEQATPRKPSD